MRPCARRPSYAQIPIGFLSWELRNDGLPFAKIASTVLEGPERILGRDDPGRGCIWAGSTTEVRQGARTATRIVSQRAMRVFVAAFLPSCYRTVQHVVGRRRRCGNDRRLKN